MPLHAKKKKKKKKPDGPSTSTGALPHESDPHRPQRERGPARVRSLARGGFCGPQKNQFCTCQGSQTPPLVPGKSGGPFGFSRLKRIEPARKSKNGRATKRHHSRKDCMHEATSRVDVVERLLRFLTDAPEDETGVTNNGRNAAAITGRASPCRSDGGIESWQGGAEGRGMVR